MRIPFLCFAIPYKVVIQNPQTKQYSGRTMGLLQYDQAGPQDGEARNRLPWLWRLFSGPGLSKERNHNSVSCRRPGRWLLPDLTQLRNTSARWDCSPQGSRWLTASPQGAALSVDTSPGLLCVSTGESPRIIWEQGGGLNGCMAKAAFHCHSLG